jgi:hypothetical protein
MRAAVVTEFGGSDVIKTQDWPEPVGSVGEGVDESWLGRSVIGRAVNFGGHADQAGAGR